VASNASTSSNIPIALFLRPYLTPNNIKRLIVLSISQKDYEHNTIPHRRNPHLFQNKETSAKKIPVIRAICVKFSIKNAATYQQKSENPKFFLTVSTQALINFDHPKNTRFFDQMRKPKQ
jgi:hypothetical protein